eukprot:10368904-Heterocapsa_arctica.AAC.1
MSPEGRRHRVWDVMEGQMDNFPDRGVERPMKSLRTDNGSERPPPKGGNAALCFVCGKTRANHDAK